MTSSRSDPFASRTAGVRTGTGGVFSLIGANLDRLIAVALLFLLHKVTDHPLSAATYFLALVVFVLYPAGGLPYSHWPPGWQRQIAGTWGVVLGALVLLGLATDTLRMFDQNLLAYWAIGTPAVHALSHLLLPRLLTRVVAMRGEQLAIVVGANKLGRRLAQSIIDDPLSQSHVLGFFDDRAGPRLGEVTEAPILGSINDVADYARHHRVHQIYIALPMASQPRILKLLDGLRDTTASVYFAPDVFMLDLIQARIDTVGGLPVVAVCETPFYGVTQSIKRVSDVLIATLALTVMAPAMLAVAIAIKLTMPGPVLFKQRRFGLDGQEIAVWKFRSMKVAEDGPDVRQATLDDDRITPLGRFLRRTSLDELPQFVNVLQGKMSVVGPRPHAVSHNEMYRTLIKGYMIRHKVKPGITGLAQISGARGETDTIEKMELRIKYDLEYLRNWSMRMDIWIIFKTIAQVFKDPQAY